MKWNDENGNGVRDEGEPGIEGVTIYLDINNNGSHEENEPITTTRGDDDSTKDVDETGQYTFLSLQPLTNYIVREVVPDGFEQTFPGRPFDFPFPTSGPDDPNGVAPFPFPFPRDFHSIWVGSGQAVQDINFGNRKIAEPGFISGVKWEDVNGNGVRDEGEKGLAGFVIFMDANRNGVQDVFEPFAISRTDDPDTPADETGQYKLKVRPGSYLVLERQQRGFEQTHPNPLREITFPFNLGHTVDVVSGKEMTNIDFGNKPVPLPATIGGMTWLDQNANGVFDRGEQPVSGVTLYLDANDNGQFDEGEQSTVSGSFFGFPLDDALIAPTGHYSFQVQPGDYVVRQVLPNTRIHTFPFGSYALGESRSQPLAESLAKELEIVSIDNTTTSPNDAGQSNTVLNIRTTWDAVAVEVLPTDIIAEGNSILVRLTGHVVEPADPSIELEGLEFEAITQVHLGVIDFGDYEVRVELSQEPHFGPDGGDEPAPGPVFELESKFSYFADDAHRVSVQSGETSFGRDFGHRAEDVPGTDGEVTQPVAGDTNGDRKVDFADFLTLSANFGKEVDGAFADGDFTGDARVDFADFLLLSERFGEEG